MTLSVIIPVFNAERYLSACINSVLTQTFSDWELLLIDDGSTDNSGAICDSYTHKDSRIRAIHTPNRGPSSARNLGMRLAEGEFLSFIDSDDIVNPSFLSNFSFDSSLDFEIQGFHLRYWSHSSEDKDVKPFETKIASIGEIYAEAEMNKLSRGPVCKLFKKSIINKYGVEYPVGIDFAEDAIFVKRYLVHCTGKARSISASDYIYNHYPSSGSLTSRRHLGQMMYDASLMDYELFMQLAQKWPFEISADVKNAFVHIRALEFYNSICLFFTEKEQSFTACGAFIQQGKEGLFQYIKEDSNLPLTYQVIKAVLWFPTKLSTTLLKLFFAVKEPDV